MEIQNGKALGGVNRGETCWGIVKDTERGCGCNSAGFVGQGIYYGGMTSCTSCNCYGGGFVGEKLNFQQKGALASVGFKLYIRCLVFFFHFFFFFCSFSFFLYFMCYIRYVCFAFFCFFLAFFCGKKKYGQIEFRHTKTKINKNHANYKNKRQNYMCGNL